LPKYYLCRLSDMSCCSIDLL